MGTKYWVLSNLVNYYSLTDASVMLWNISLYLLWKICQCPQLPVSALKSCQNATLFITIYCIVFCGIPIDFALYLIIRIFLSKISADLRPLPFLSSGSSQLKEDSNDIFNNFFFLPEDKWVHMGVDFLLSFKICNL